MTEKVFLPLNLQMESFFEIDNKDRRKIYIYLWFTLFFSFIVLLEGRAFIASLPNKVPPDHIEFLYVFWCIIDFIALLSLSLGFTKKLFCKWIIKIFILDIHVQTLCYIYVYQGLFRCFKVVTGQDSIESLSSLSYMLRAIVALWALKYIWKLRKHVLNKIT